jgi:hypothetical protein
MPWQPTGRTRRFRATDGEQYELTQVELRQDGWPAELGWQIETGGLAFRLESVDDPSLKWMLSGQDDQTREAIKLVADRPPYPTMRPTVSRTLDLMQSVVKRNAAAQPQ